MRAVEQLLANKKPWLAFLRVGLDIRDCPTETVREALEWTASTSIGLLDVASVDPLTSVCNAFQTLIEAAEDSSERAERIVELIALCTSLVDVFIAHGKQRGDLILVMEPLEKVVSIMTDLAKIVRRLGARSKITALLRRKTDAQALASFHRKLSQVCVDVQGKAVHSIVRKLEGSLRPPSAPDMADIPVAALALPSTYVNRPALVSEIVERLTATYGAPCALTGMGGSGKSVLASCVVRTKEIREHFRGGMFWLRVGRGGKDQLQALFEGLAMEASVYAARNRYTSVAEVIQHLTMIVAEDTLPRLVVLDDVWEREIVDTLQPTGLQLLVTTRRRSVVPAGACIVVGDMGTEEARELLQHRSGATELPREEADQVRCQLLIQIPLRYFFKSSCRQFLYLVHHLARHGHFFPYCKPFAMTSFFGWNSLELPVFVLIANDSEDIYSKLKMWVV